MKGCLCLPRSCCSGCTTRQRQDRFTLGWLMGRLHKRSFGPIMPLLAVVAIAPDVSIVAGLLLMIPASQMIAVFGLITGATNQGRAMHFPKSSNGGVSPDWFGNNSHPPPGCNAKC
ncbi:exopolysaccharide biosynthesis protein [Bradyrhizobium arachidis]|uniref:Uncharacterized protein n=2 Tax=Bradyrhizobium arachidis TaxID=858423 RepID=A0AAE7NIX6_9BRAD|nr:hypothetical protein WN72_07955 [Bradyrhizobium arachidis]